jgi:hypothetical protein
MIGRRRTLLRVALLLLLAIASGMPRLSARWADTLPAKLTDAEFWRLSGDLSEPNGSFRTDNLLSNELRYPEVLAELVKRVKPGGVYLGVGPEQNFNYITAIRPRMAFITDVRRGNLHAQLMYKALFELSSDRAEFVSRLFTKPRPAGLTSATTAPELMQAFWNADVATSPQAMYEQNLQQINDLLTKKHTLPLPKDDLDGIAYVYYNFYWFGPSITYSSSSNGNGGRGNTTATYHQLMSALDSNGVPSSFLATEDSFRFMKEMEERNLIVPVVGNFGGPKALKAVGQYVRDHGAVVSAFYISNVEQYLQQDGIWGIFCANVASMPLDEQSTFIRSQSGAGGGGGGFINMLGMMEAETRGCAPRELRASARPGLR